MKRAMLGVVLASMIGGFMIGGPHATASEMPLWQLNLIVEEQNIRERVQGLMDFTATENFNAMSSVEAELILDQIREGVDYDQVLLRRIRLF